MENEPKLTGIKLYLIRLKWMKEKMKQSDFKNKRFFQKVDLIYSIVLPWLSRKEDKRIAKNRKARRLITS